MTRLFIHADGSVSECLAEVPANPDRLQIISVDSLPGEMSRCRWIDGRLDLVPASSLTADQGRARRNALLAACDWTQLPDSPEANRAAWSAYRQALRDVPEQPGFPATVVWPSPPA